MLKAKDMMTRDVVSARKDTPILEALKLIAEHNISGMPVVKDDMTLLGIVSETDLLTLFNNKEDISNKTVDDFMTQPPLFFDADESLLDVRDFLAKNVFRRVPITSEGKLVGIISIRDFVEHILQPIEEKIVAD